MFKLIGLGVGIALLASSAPAQERRGACLREVMQLCSGGGNRDNLRACLVNKIDQLSPNCRARLMERVAKRDGGGKAAAPAAGGTEYAYGSDAKQKLDFWRGASAKAPLVVFIHGGGWSIGDKKRGDDGKSAAYTAMGYAFASLNYRLVPNAKPDGQAADVANAIAWLRRDAARLGFDADRIVLMGHSAGAHLAALVSSDPQYLAKAGMPMRAIAGTVLLDGAGYDVAKQMADKGNRVGGLYDKAFGSDAAYQAAMSPTNHTVAPNVGKWLILHVEKRADSGAQSNALGTGLRGAGAAVTVTSVPNSTHMSVNHDAGVADSFVGQQIAAFLRAAF